MNKLIPFLLLLLFLSCQQDKPVAVTPVEQSVEEYIKESEESVELHIKESEEYMELQLEFVELQIQFITAINKLNELAVNHMELQNDYINILTKHSNLIDSLDNIKRKNIEEIDRLPDQPPIFPEDSIN